MRTSHGFPEEDSDRGVAPKMPPDGRQQPVIATSGNL